MMWFLIHFLVYLSKFQGQLYFLRKGQEVFTVELVDLINHRYHSPLLVYHWAWFPLRVGKHPFLIPVFPQSQHFPNDFWFLSKICLRSNKNQAGEIIKGCHGKTIWSPGICLGCGKLKKKAECAGPSACYSSSLQD